jgi:hypothetical protein
MKACWLLPLTLVAAGCGEAARTTPAETAATAKPDNAAPAITTPGKAAATADWGGTYTAEHLIPESGNETTPAIEYRLVLDDDNCALTIQGFQSDDSIVCSAQALGADLVVAFKSFADGKLTNRFEVEPYKVGERLLTLKSADGKIAGEWGALVPHDNARPLEFVKQ